MSDEWKNKTILLIDDEEMMHELTQAFLEKVGYRCIFAFSGREGLQRLLKENPDLVLLDYFLPDMDGATVYDEMLSNSEYESCRETPVIMLTARNRDPIVQSNLLEKGVSAFLHKPFGLRELKNVIENVFIIYDIQRRNKLLTQEIQQTNDYLELVLNSAPVAIFSTDKDGNILRANPSFTQYIRNCDSCIGRTILSLDILENKEIMDNIEGVLKQGSPFELKNIELLSPTENRVSINFRCVPLYQNNQISGCLGIIEDITESEKRAYEFYTLTQISQAMQSTLDLDILLHLILTSITAGCALSFSRAMIFLLDSEQNLLVGRMGVGPSSSADAHRIWSTLDQDANMSLVDFLEKYGKRKPDTDDEFNKLVQSISLPLERQQCVLVETVRKGLPFRVKTPDLEIDVCCQEIYQKLQLEEFVSVPLISEDKVIGIIVADNLYSEKPLDESRVTLLTLCANQATQAVERTNTYKNIAEQKAALERALKELRRTQNQLIHSEHLAAVGKMAAHVAHEIRNPLVTIGGFAQSMLKSTKTYEDLQEMASIIANEVRRLEKILYNVLDFSRVPKPNFQWSNLNEVIRNVCLLIEKEISTAHIHCIKSLDDSIPEFYFDPEQIKQVLLNILRNAIQSLNEKEGAVTIKSRYVSAQEIEMQISDTGSGVRRDMLENIFNPFFSTRPDGTGLGLAITQQIINDHGGLIRAESELGEGTTFYLTLPLRTHPPTNGTYTILTEDDKEELLHF